MTATSRLEFLYQLQFVWVQLQLFPWDILHCGLCYLQFSDGPLQIFSRPPNKTFTHSVNYLFCNTWPPCTASLDDKSIFHHEIVHATFGQRTQVNHNAQTATGTCLELPQHCLFAQIPGHIKYTWFSQTLLYTFPLRCQQQHCV